jgi:hypothetical protein
MRGKVAGMNTSSILGSRGKRGKEGREQFDFSVPVTALPYRVPVLAF